MCARARLVEVLVYCFVIARLHTHEAFAKKISAKVLVTTLVQSGIPALYLDIKVSSLVSLAEREA